MSTTITISSMQIIYLTILLWIHAFTKT